MEVEHYTNLIIGSGEAGKYLAWNLATLGQRTAVVERSMLGGACPNVACLPSKNVIYSAKAVSLVHPSVGLGVVSGALEVNMFGVARRKREMVTGLAELHLGKFQASGAEVIMGEARFIAEKTVRVVASGGSERIMSGDRIFLCVGSRAALPNIPGLSAAEPMTHVEALDLERLPPHLVILGGGYVGLEFAQALRRLGSRVTIIQRGTQLLEHEDPDVSQAMLEMMQSDGVDVLRHAEVLNVSGRSGASLSLTVRSNATDRIVEGSDILVATGRVPNTDGLGAEAAHVELDQRGYIRVDEKLRTTAPDIWGMGDCTGGPKFTHVSYDDFRVVLSGLTGGDRTTTGRLVPYCLFTDPELARIGVSESEAKAQGLIYRVAKIPMTQVMRMRTISQTRGFLKALIGEDDRVIGFTAFSSEASETLAVVQTAMIGKLPYTALRDAIFTHPTAAEGLVALFTSGFQTN